MKDGDILQDEKQALRADIVAAMKRCESLANSANAYVSKCLKLVRPGARHGVAFDRWQAAQALWREINAVYNSADSLIYMLDRGYDVARARADLAAVNERSEAWKRNAHLMGML